MTWKAADVGDYDWSSMFDEVDSLHVKRNHLVGCSHLDIIDRILYIYIYMVKQLIYVNLCYEV
jgi:hypothetical protein